MIKVCVAASVMVAAAAVPAAARPAPQPLFAVTDVDRDTVPPGTPAAFRAAFGVSPTNESRRAVDGTNYIYVPLTLIPLPGGSVALISTGASECDGHACSGLNSVHYMRRDGGSYTVEGEWLDVGAAGTFGNPAMTWGWTDVIADSPVLYTDGGGVWQGYACSFADLTELAPGGPVKLASIPIYYSNSGAVENGATDLTGIITAAEKGRSFTVTYTGSKSFSERYVRGADGTYTLSGKSRVPSC